MSVLDCDNVAEVLALIKAKKAEQEVERLRERIERQPAGRQRAKVLIDELIAEIRRLDKEADLAVDMVIDRYEGTVCPALEAKTTALREENERLRQELQDSETPSMLDMELSRAGMLDDPPERTFRCLDCNLSFEPSCPMCDER